MAAANALNNLAKAAVGIGTSISLAQAAMYDVDGGFRAVMFDRLRGVQRSVVGEGTHFRIPWLQTPHLFDVRIRPRNIASNTGTKDLQVVTINLRVLSRPDEEHLPDISSSLGLDYDERVLPSIGNEVLKAVVAQYNAESLITKREMVSREVREALTKRAMEFHIKLDDVAITDLKFGKEFTAAIESKQVAEQDAERARFLVEKSEQEKKAAIIRAEGESSAAKVVSEALQASPALVELRRIEAAKDIADTLSKSRNVTYLPSGGQNMCARPPPRSARRPHAPPPPHAQPPTKRLSFDRSRSLRRCRSRSHPRAPRASAFQHPELTLSLTCSTLGVDAQVAQPRCSWCVDDLASAARHFRRRRRCAAIRRSCFVMRGSWASQLRECVEISSDAVDVWCEAWRREGIMAHTEI